MLAMQNLADEEQLTPPLHSPVVLEVYEPYEPTEMIIDYVQTDRHKQRFFKSTSVIVALEPLCLAVPTSTIAKAPPSRQATAESVATLKKSGESDMTESADDERSEGGEGEEEVAVVPTPEQDVRHESTQFSLSGRRNLEHEQQMVQKALEQSDAASEGVVEQQVVVICALFRSCPSLQHTPLISAMQSVESGSETEGPDDAGTHLMEISKLSVVVECSEGTSPAPPPQMVLVQATICAYNPSTRAGL